MSTIFNQSDAVLLSNIIYKERFPNGIETEPKNALPYLLYDVAKSVFNKCQNEKNELSNSLIYYKSEASRCDKGLFQERKRADELKRELEELKRCHEEELEVMRAARDHWYNEAQKLTDKLYPPTPETPSFPPRGAPDPGEGYRLLDPKKDKKQKADQCCHKNDKRCLWLKCIMDMPFLSDYWYRRKIEPKNTLETMLATLRDQSDGSLASQALILLLEREIERQKSLSKSE